MIIQSISKGIKEQDWFVVMVEVMIVVVGIFIGLQVDEWNETRNKLKEDQIFLDQLSNDLVVIRKSLVDAKEIHSQHLERGITALGVLGGAPTTENNRQWVEDGILRIHQMPFPRTNLGNFGMLIDKQVPVPSVNPLQRKRLIDFLDNISFRLKIYDHIALFVNESVSILNTRMAEPVEGETTIPAILDIDALRGDAEFIASLQNIVSRHGNAIRIINFIIDLIDEFQKGETS